MKKEENNNDCTILFTQEDVNKIIATERRNFKNKYSPILKKLNAKEVSDAINNVNLLLKLIEEYKIKELKYLIFFEYKLDIKYIDFIPGDDSLTIKKNVLKLLQLMNKE